MVDTTNKDENENTDQTDFSDEDALNPSEDGKKPEDDELNAETGGEKPEDDELNAETAESSTERSAETGQESGDSMENVMNLYEESFKRFAEGEVVTGRIISIDKDHVLVDIGYKSEGQIRLSEFKDEDGNLTAEMGDSVEVMVEWWDDEEERVVLSKEKAANIKTWDAIKKSYDDDGTG